MADRRSRSRPDPQNDSAERPPQPAPAHPSKQTDQPVTGSSLPDFLVVGQVVRPHGVRGDLLVEASSETFRSIQAGGELFLGASEQPETVVSLRPHQGRHILHLEGYEDREAAEALRGTKIRIALVEAEPLPEGVYYRWQVLGLPVVDQAGRPLGSLIEIIETGANDVYVVERAGAPDLLLPAIESVILAVDLEGGAITVAVPEGLDPAS